MQLIDALLSDFCFESEICIRQFSIWNLDQHPIHQSFRDWIGNGRFVWLNRCKVRKLTQRMAGRGRGHLLRAVAEARGQLAPDFVVHRRQGKESTAAPAPQSTEIERPSDSSVATSIDPGTSCSGGRLARLLKAAQDARGSTRGATTTSDSDGNLTQSLPESSQQLPQKAPATDSQSESPEEPIEYVGTSGSTLRFVGNYVKLAVKADSDGLYEYDVAFQPNIDHVKERYQCMYQLKDIIGDARSFDGVKLFLPGSIHPSGHQVKL